MTAFFHIKGPFWPGCIILRMPRRPNRVWLLPVAVVLLFAIYYLPPVHDRLGWRIDNLRTQIKYYLNPPAEAVFVPAQQAEINAIVAATMQAHATEQAPSATLTAPDATSLPTPTATATPIPLPPEVSLPGVVFVSQEGGFNLCAPSNLTMALKFWGWKGSRDEVIRVVKPGENNPSENDVQRGKTDLNVMPYELVDFVNNDTEFRALYRYGGDIDLLKRLVADGFPVVAEKGIYETDIIGKVSWIGHYLFVTGYDDATQTFLVQDSYITASAGGPNYHVSYSDFLDGWRAFDRVFYVVYPVDREGDVMKALGPYADPKVAAQRALDFANQEIQTATGVPLFFAWFARGTSHVALQEYVDAANAYDQAYAIYGTLDQDYSTLPWRMMWYQTGPYFAYFYSGRYQDVLDLANLTLDPVKGHSTLEESLYWRGMAEYAVGNTQAAITDMRKAIYYNKNFKAAMAQLQQWGVGQ
jgi:hypothetical protein